jgi:hypothetical protein
VRDESSASNAGVADIPSQLKVAKQILLHWQPFRDLNLKYVGSRQAEQLIFRSQQRIVSWGFMVYGEYPRDIPEVYIV